MATIREQITDDVVALLNAGSPPVTVKRSYGFAVDLEAAKSIIVYPKSDVADPPLGGRTGGLSNVPVKRMLTLAVECRSKGTPTERADAEADVLAAWVVKTICGKKKGPADAGGPLYHGITEGETTFEYDQRDHAYCLVTVEILVAYQSRANDPETWA